LGFIWDLEFGTWDFPKGGGRNLLSGGFTDGLEDDIIYRKGRAIVYLS
jgi:hypothetical protein